MIKNTVDLIPREFARQRRERARLAAWAVVGIAALTAVLFSALSLSLRARSVEAAVAPLREQVAALRMVRAEVQPLTEQLQSSLERHQLISQLLLEPRWSAVIQDLSLAVSPEVWVESLQFEQPMDATPDTRAPSLLLTGTAATDRALLQFMEAFSASALIESLTLQQSQLQESPEENAGPTVQFVLGGTLRLSQERQ